jgi:hypothetical protein
MSTEKVNEAPMMILEVLTTGESGYVRDDTRGTDFEETINCPGLLAIPNTGLMAEEIIDNGKPTGRYKNIKIRYIKDCPYIRVDEQEKYNIEKSNVVSNDSLSIKKGKAVLKREGDVAKFDYLKNVFWNLDAPNRSRTAKALFKVVELEQKVKAMNEDKFLQAEALTTVSRLVIKTGGQYKFKEDKIDNLLTALNKHGGDNYSEKINVLTNHAEKFPKEFLDIANTLDNITVTLIAHAIELNVIRFEGFTAEYVDSKSILATVSNENKSSSKKMEALSDMLKTPELAQAYQELQAKVEIAKENELKA